jgi:hypothetical protein
VEVFERRKLREKRNLGRVSFGGGKEKLAFLHLLFSSQGKEGSK